jgi:hypothetical protein
VTVSHGERDLGLDMVAVHRLENGRLEKIS